MTWEEPCMIDPIEPTSIAPSTLRGYILWLAMVKLALLGYDEEDEDEEMVISPLKGYSNKNERNINNPIHDKPMWWHPFIPTPGLDTLVESLPLALVGKSLLQTYRFIMFMIFFLNMLWITNL